MAESLTSLYSFVIVKTKAESIKMQMLDICIVCALLKSCVAIITIAAAVAVAVGAVSV